MAYMQQDLEVTKTLGELKERTWMITAVFNQTCVETCMEIVNQYHNGVKVNLTHMTVSWSLIDGK